MTFAPEFLEAQKVKAFQHRQRDTGWGYAFAHLIPFVGLWYAFDRYTITPFLYSAVGSFAISSVVGLVMIGANPQTSQKEADGIGYLTCIITSPFLVKKGIERAREYGKLKLLASNKPLTANG